MRSFPRKTTFKVYYSPAYTYLRIVMILAPIICYGIATWTNMIWMYLTPIIMLVVSIFVFSYINAKILLTSDGIYLINCAKTQHYLWNELQFVGCIEIWPLGCTAPVKIIYFSKKKVAYPKLRQQKSLPQLSGDFVFVLEQPKLMEALSMYLPPTKFRQIYNSNEAQKGGFKF